MSSKYDIINFLINYSNSDIIDSTDLDDLVISYKKSKSDADFANVCGKAIGIILSVLKVNSYKLEEDDIFSYAFDALFKAVNKWNKEKSKFITYYYKCLINELCILKQKKSVRDYCNYVVSLDDLVGNNFDKIYYDKYNLVTKLNYSTNEEKELIDFIIKFNVTKKSDICKAFEIDKLKLRKIIRKILKQNKKLVQNLKKLEEK